ncbi:MAG: Fur family transcriptional regulator, ferric uptake regulator [Solirubrobacteraceae bacterium]|nr:Fur family transcriptional regulator, ferric uptake regulator [Solirubrobacteraceae bacterium]
MRGRCYPAIPALTRLCHHDRMHRSAQKGWLEHAGEVLRGAGLRSSAGRTAVVELLGRQSCLLTAQDIADRLRETGSAGSTATVYRALETLHELGLVRRFDSGEGVARYEPVDPSGDHHHHIVMEDSGDVVPFEDEELERAIEGLGERLGLVVTSHDIILRARPAD